MEVDNTTRVLSWNSLPELLKPILPQNYTYLIINLNELPSYRTSENFSIAQFELDAFVDVSDKEKASEWFVAFESHSKTTMPQTKGYEIKGKQVLFREKRHCIHSNEVKKKQAGHEIKRPQSSRMRNTNCKATIHLRLENWRKESSSHPLEINIKFTHNHVINSAEALSFRRVKEGVRERYLELFNDGHSPASALYSYEDELHLSTTNEQELMELLADRSSNPDYDYILKLFQQNRETILGARNGKLMFERLTEVVNEYNASGRGKAALQEYDSSTGKSYILCVVTSLMCRVHEKVPQAAELCYMDASASFEPLNTSITLFYTSCAVGALPIALFITSDELEITLEKAINLLKTILPPHAFFGRGPQTGPMVFMTDDSSAERNALELCWPQGIRLLCTFHVLQAFWRWLYDSKHRINKEERTTIMEKMKKILYASSISEMETHYNEFKQSFYCSHPLLKKHFELLWERRRFWAHSFRSGLPIRGNNTNNYVERSFCTLKDIIFSRMQAYNSVQVFQFVTANMERFYERRLLGFSHRHPGHLRVAKRFFCPGWETVDANSIQRTSSENEYLVPSTAQNNSLIYIVNSDLGVCSCPVGMSGAPCKHQGAVAIKFHIVNFNFLPSLTPDDRMLYAYIAIGYVAKNKSFYASLHSEPASQDQYASVYTEFSLQGQGSLQTEQTKGVINSEYREPNDKIEEIDASKFTRFLEEIKEDYLNTGSQLRTALNKFAERYQAAKSVSIPRLTSFVYDIGGHVDPTVRVRSGSMIRVQVESVKRRKTEGSSRKRKLPTIKNKENLDPQIIPNRKMRKTGKKEHSLSKNVGKNQLN